MQATGSSFEIDPYAQDVLELLFERMPMGVMFLSPNYQILRYNATWASYFERYNPAVVSMLQPGLNYFDLLPETRETFEPFFQHALKGEIPREPALGIITGGRRSYWNIVAAPLTEEGEVKGIMVVGTDVTEQIESKQALKDALHELQLSHAAIEQRIEERTREMKTLITVQQAFTSSLNRNEVLQIIAREARRLTHTDVAAVFLPEDDKLLLAVLSSDYPLDLAPGYRISVEDSITGAAFRSGQTQFVMDIRQHPYVDPNAINRAALKSLLAIPLISGDRVIGVLSVGNQTAGVLGAEQERLLSLITPSIVIALENVRVYAQASETAVAAERGRLARDLHDAVTQTLFSASLTAEVLPRIWARDPQEGMIRLGKLRELTRGALAEMRTLLLELRPTALVETQLGDLLHQLAEGISGRIRIEIKVIVNGDADPPPEVKVALYRIAQEALNNVAKHSMAPTATVRLNQTKQTIEMLIEDTGIGFDPVGNRANHLGLRIMVERADAIQAVLSIKTTIEQGTQIHVVWTKEGMPN